MVCTEVMSLYTGHLDATDNSSRRCASVRFPPKFQFGIEAVNADSFL
jgi:hypothetical protein